MRACLIAYGLVSFSIPEKRYQTGVASALLITGHGVITKSLDFIDQTSPLPVVLFLNGEGGILGSHSPKMVPGWMPGRPSLALNKPDLEALSGSGVPPPGLS